MSCYHNCHFRTGESVNGKLIDTVVDESFMLAGETVNCCQHVQDLKAIGNS